MGAKVEFLVKSAGIRQVAELQKHVRIENLPSWCASIGAVQNAGRDKGEADFPWGRWRVHREVIRDGLRFTLPGRADALQWTLTLDPSQRGGVIVHLTLACEEAEAAHQQAIEAFMAHWQVGLAAWPQRAAALAQRPRGECTPSFGGFG